MHHAMNRSVEFWSSEFVAKAIASTRGFQIFDPMLSSGLSPANQQPQGNSPAASPTSVSLFVEDSESPHLESGESSCDDGSPGSVSERSLKSLLPQARFFSGKDIHFESIADSAEQCVPGQLVVYRIGIDCPVEIIAEALARGAAGILTEQILPAPLPQCIVSDTDRALAEIASRELIAEDGARPDQRLLTIGVVGNHGKTSTALLVAAVLKDVPCRVAYETDLGHSDGIGSDVSEDSPAQGADLVRRVCEAADAGAAVTVLELDDRILRSGGYDELSFDLLVVTRSSSTVEDFGPSPLDCAIERVMPDGVLIVDVGDQVAMNVASASSLTLLTYGVDTPADVSLKTIGIEDGVLSAMIRHDMNSAMMESMVGRGTMATSLAAAAAVGVATENPLVQIVESLGQVRTIPGRIERIVCDDWDRSQVLPDVFVDAGGSPERLEFTLTRLQDEIDQRSSATIPMKGTNHSKPAVWCVLAPGLEESTEAMVRYGRKLETLGGHAIVTCHQSQKHQFLSLSHYILDGVEDCAMMRLVADQERAIAWAIQAAAPQDVVLVVGGLGRSSAHEQRSDIKRIRETVVRCHSASEISSSKMASSHSSAQDQPSLKLYDPDA